jgi:dipeptidyl aminopeptidase/acylaminoacyl peptidase
MAAPATRAYWLRLTTFFVGVVTLTLTSLPLLLGALSAGWLLYVPCGRSAATPAAFGLPAEPVSLPARAGGSFNGLFIPGSNGAVIIMPPPFNADRHARLPEAAMLHRHGYSIFLFDSRPCAGMGPLSLGYNEVDEVADALDYVSRRPEVEPARVGLHGFSSAGATAIMAAARYPQVRAVVAEGGYADFNRTALGETAQLRHVADAFLWLYRAGMRLTYRLVIGAGIEQLSPLAVIDQLAPRPLLLIYGSREASLPGARLQAAAAGPSAQLWVVEGAGHGTYAQIAPAEYERRIVDFFDAALGGGG